jgi:hypothetical protein
VFVVNTPDKRENTTTNSEGTFGKFNYEYEEGAFFCEASFIHFCLTCFREKKTVLEAVVLSRRRVAKTRECFEVTKLVRFEFIKLTKINKNFHQFCSFSLSDSEQN